VTKPKYNYMAEIINLEGAQESTSQTPKFDPAKKYSWALYTVFSISGGEFGLLLNTLRAITSTKEAQTVILAQQAGDVLEKTLASGVESGIIVEIPEQQ
jgi:hypothetical protein